MFDRLQVISDMDDGNDGWVNLGDTRKRSRSLGEYGSSEPSAKQVAVMDDVDEEGWFWYV